LDVERSAVVEVTPEDNNFPGELAFMSGDTRGWRAEVPGNQTWCVNGRSLVVFNENIGPRRARYARGVVPQRAWWGCVGKRAVWGASDGDPAPRVSGKSNSRPQSKQTW